MYFASAEKIASFPPFVGHSALFGRLAAGQFFGFLFQLLRTLVWSRQVLRHRPAEPLYGLAHFRPDFPMRLVRLVLAGDALAADLFLRLRGPEDVCRQFGTAHVIENMPGFLQAFTLVDVLHGQAAVQPLVAMVLEDGIVYRFDDARPLGGRGQRFVPAFQVLAVSQAQIILAADALIGEFLPPGLDGEVGLAGGDDGFGRICILDEMGIPLTAVA